MGKNLIPAHSVMRNPHVGKARLMNSIPNQYGTPRSSATGFSPVSTENGQLATILQCLNCCLLTRGPDHQEFRQGG
jgi:hypothetical protein